MSAFVRTLAIVGLAFGVPVLPLCAQADGEASRGPRTVEVLPGDPRLDVNRLVPHRATWRVTIHDAEGGSTVQGLWTDTWVRSEEDGRPVAIFRTLFVDTLGKVLVDNETVFDAATFRALRSAQHLPPSGTLVTYRYHGDTVAGTLRRAAGEESRQFEVAFDEPVWEPLTPVRWLLPFDGLAPGTVVRYPIWDQTPSGDAVTWRTIRIGSIRSLRATDGSTVETLSHTMTTDAEPGVLFCVLRMVGPPYLGWWLRVERPGLTREWALVDWEPYAPLPGGRGAEVSRAVRRSPGPLLSRSSVSAAERECHREPRPSGGKAE